MAIPPRDHLKDHEYDGIREFDNPTPGWWHAIFIASIVFSVLYFIYFEFNQNAPSPHTRLARMQLEEDRQLFGALGDLEPTQDRMLHLMGDAKLMNVAEAWFVTSCSQCHARDGGGIGTAPNLTDDHYRNVKTLPDFYNVITNGAANGAMPSWQAAFSKNQRVLLAAYAASLRGKQAASPLGPMGEPIEPWPDLATTDPAPDAPPPSP